jgi:hypothetical protein
MAGKGSIFFLSSRFYVLFLARVVSYARGVLSFLWKGWLFNFRRGSVFLPEKDYVNIKRTEINPKNFLHKTRI